MNLELNKFFEKAVNALFKKVLIFIDLLTKPLINSSHHIEILSGSSPRYIEGSTLLFHKKQVASGFLMRLMLLIGINILKFSQWLIGESVYVLRQGLFVERPELWRLLYVANVLRNFNILSYIGRVKKGSDQPHMYYWLATVNEGCGGVTHAAGCSSVKEELALARCVGETIERYSNSTIPYDTFLVSSFRNIRVYALDPNDIPSITNEQRKKLHSPFLTHDSIFRWVRGISLYDDVPCFLPAQLVYLGYQRLPEEPVLRSYITTGAAAFSSDDPDQAIVNGIFEVIERDAFIINWVHARSIPAIDIKSIKNEKIKNLYSKFSQHNLKIRVLDMRIDIPIPIFLGIVLDSTGKGPAVAVSGKVELDPEETLLRIMESALHMYYFSRSTMQKYSDSRNSSRQPGILEKRVLRWEDPENLKSIKFWTDTKEIPLPAYPLSDSFRGISSTNKKKKLVKLLHSYGMHPIVVNQTPPAIHNLGFVSVSVFILEAQHLWLDEDFSVYNGKRLEMFRNTAGHPFNVLPHPFA